MRTFPIVIFEVVTLATRPKQSIPNCGRCLVAADLSAISKKPAVEVDRYADILFFWVLALRV